MADTKKIVACAMKGVTPNVADQERRYMMKDIISREETINLINEHFDRLEKEIREHCVISDAVMVISKCIKTKNALKKDIRELKSRFTAKENKMRNEKPREYEDGWIDAFERLRR